MSPSRKGSIFVTDDAPKDLGMERHQFLIWKFVQVQLPNTCLKYGAHERFRVRDVTLENL